jgi:hypothetical protein
MTLPPIVKLPNAPGPVTPKIRPVGAPQEMPMQAPGSVGSAARALAGRVGARNPRLALKNGFSSDGSGHWSGH